MSKMSKITYANGRTEDIELPSPEEMDMSEQEIVDSIPDDLWKELFDDHVTKQSILDAFNKSKGTPVRAPLQDIMENKNPCSCCAYGLHWRHNAPIHKGKV